MLPLRIKFTLIFLLCFNCFLRQASASNTHVYLIGNLVDIDIDHSVFVYLEKELESMNDPFAVIINGDICGNHLNNSDKRTRDSVKIQRLINLSKGHEEGRIIFIPGDRDWLNASKKGHKNVKELEKLVKSMDAPHVIFDPDDGCPGPKSKKIGKDLVLVSLNTQWWNNPAKRPEESDAVCDFTTNEDVLEELEDIISESDNKNVIVAGHFPIKSTGEYGGHNPLRRHLFPLTDLNKSLYIPLPVIGSVYSAYRQQEGANRDIHNRHYEELRKQLQTVFSEHGSVIYASGHEHNLSVVRNRNSYFVNSGSLGEQRYAAQMPEALYSQKENGFIEVLYADNGEVSTIIHSFDKDAQPKRIDLMSSSCSEPGELPVNQLRTLCKERPDNSPAKDTPPTTTVIANETYTATGLQRVMLGKHYRDSWTKSVEVPYLNLDTTFGGLTPYKEGGGRQTTSLKFKAANGRKYTFRSVDKDPTAALEPGLRQSGVGKLVKDQTTTQHPYGALAADPMLDALGILHPKPVLYVMPDDPALGIYRQKFAGMLGMLEDDPKGDGFGGAKDVDKSYKLFQELFESNETRVDQLEFARARIFDIFVGDWGKHQDNWKWAEYKEGDLKIYRPIPRDRDHMFSKWDGVLPYLASREWSPGGMAAFNEKIENIAKFTWPARHLDRLLLTGIERGEWLKLVDEFLEVIDDKLIEEAIQNMPESTLAVDGNEIATVLKARRGVLRERILEYYLYLAKEVDVVGTGDEEYFDVTRLADGNIKVVVGSYDDEKKAVPYYQRLFLAHETNEIRLYGLGDDDLFTISGKAKKSIRVRVFPGSGDDVVTDESTISGLGKKTLVYARKEDKDWELGTEARLKPNEQPELYDYHRQAWKKPNYLPMPILSYNIDDGFGVGMSVTFNQTKFGKSNFAASHKIGGSITTRSFYKLFYENRFYEVFGKWDVLGKVSYASPEGRNYFYGFGNETTKSDSLYDERFYLVRRKSLRLNLGLARPMGKRSEFQLLIGYENNERNFGSSPDILDNVVVVGEKPINLYQAVAKIDVNFLDNTIFPKKGMRLFLKNSFGYATKTDAGKGNTYFNRTEAHVSYFNTTPNRIFPVTLGAQLGASQIDGKGIPFYEYPFLGQNSNLRGYRQNRFTGDQNIYLNTECRIRLLDKDKAFIPYEFGLLGFYDVGRVFMGGFFDDSSDEWHSGYGGGFFFLPYSQDFTLQLTVTTSEEESLLVLFGLGTYLR